MRRALSAFVLASLAHGCVESRGQFNIAELAEQDSAGVTCAAGRGGAPSGTPDSLKVIESSRERLPGTIRVAPTAHTVLGGDEGGLTFGRIGGAAIVAGQLIVADAMTQEVIAVSLTDHSHQVLMRHGQGPMEVTKLISLTRYDHSKVLVSEPDRYTIADVETGEGVTRALDEKLRDTVLHVRGAGAVSSYTSRSVRGALADSILLLVTPGPNRTVLSDPPPGVEIEDRAPDRASWAVGAAGLLEPQYEVPKADIVRIMFRNGTVYSYPLPFAPEGDVVVGGDAAFLSRGDAYEVIRIRPDSPPTVIRLCIDGSRIVTQEDVQAYHDEAVRRAKDPDLESRLIHMATFPATKAPVGKLLVDDRGRLWLEDRGSNVANTWRIISPDGAWLDSVQLPQGTLLSVGDGWVALRVDLGLGVDGIALHRLEDRTPGTEALRLTAKRASDAGDAGSPLPLANLVSAAGPRAAP